MSKKVVSTMKLESELRAEFMAEAQATHRPASQVLRALMREFVERQRAAREYDAYFHRKVEAGRASMNAGRSRSDGEQTRHDGLELPAPGNVVGGRKLDLCGASPPLGCVFQVGGSGP